VKYLDKVEGYGDKHILKNLGDYSQDSLSFKHVLGKYQNYLYALFIVRDEKVVYRDKSLMRLVHSDHLQIVMQEPNQQFSILIKRRRKNVFSAYGEKLKKVIYWNYGFHYH